MIPAIAHGSALGLLPRPVVAWSDRLVQASTYAGDVDRSLEFVAWFAVFTTVVVAGGLVLLALARRDGAPTSSATTRRIVRGTIAAAFLLAAFFFVHGTLVWADLQVPPRGALAIRVAVGEKGFAFTYPNNVVVNELHLPIDRPVRLLLRGDAAPYTFAVPEFRLQVPVAVRTDASAWVEPTVAGEYTVRSGVRPRASANELAATVVVHADAGFDTWYQGVSGPNLDLPPVELGRASFQMRGCTQCHTIDGTKLVGPSFKGFRARERRLKDGTPIVADDAYIVESILDPQAKVLDGFEPVMPSFKGRLHEKEIAGLVAFIQSMP